MTHLIVLRGGGDYLNFDRYCNARTVVELLKLEGKLP